ncbi:response regulator [Raoultella planticola]|nr:response regulator [Raoultella planticola]
MLKSKYDVLFYSSRQAPRLPKALLCSFAMAFLSCIAVASFFYIYYSVNNTISDYRRQMNAAAYNAQYFFDEREAMLQSMAAAIVHLPGRFSSGQVSEAVPFPEITVYPLRDSDNQQRHGVIMSRRDIAGFDRSKTQLIYTSARTGRTTTVLPAPNPKPGLSSESERQIMTFLSSQVWQMGEDGSLPIAWFNPPGDEEDRLYLYTPVDVDDPQSGWLGLTFCELASSIDLSTLSGGKYDLIDPQGLLALHGNSMHGQKSYWVGRFLVDTFGVTGGRLFPEFLVLRKSVGHGGWSLAYSVPVSQLVKKNLPVLHAVVLVATALIMFVILSLWYLSRRVLQPALSQFSALMDSAALNRKLVETAPIGLALVRGRDAELLFSNELAYSWVQSDRQWFTRISAVDDATGARELTLYDGRTIQLSCTATSWGGEAAILCVLSDVSGLKAVERSLVEAKSMAESANQAKTLFLTTMSHEIRTPLYGILGTLELFALSGLSGQQREYMRTLLHSSSSLLRIVNDSLDLSSIEAGQLTLERAPFSPMELAELVVETYAAKAENKGLHIYTLSDVNVPPLVQGDATRVRQVLDNLINNAVKFTLSGHVVLRLEAGQQYGDTVSLIFQVVDTGVGITSEHLPRLFEPYFRSANKLTGQDSGSGLGLSICSRLAQLMEGRLWAISEHNLGTRFTFEVTLPLAEDSNMPPVPQLLPEPVYVDGAVPEIVNNLCDWLRHWGAQALPFRNVTLSNDSRGILVQTWPPSIHTTHWYGKRIIALPPTLGHEQTTESDTTVITGAYSVTGIGRVVQSMQLDAAPLPAAASDFIGETFGLRLLVVDDSPISHIILREQLELLGCDVVLATNGCDALNLSDILTFDAVLTDLHMPDLDGYEVARKLREQGYEGQIVGLTGNAYQQEKTTGHRAGMNALLRKPLSLSQLRAMLRTIIISRN